MSAFTRTLVASRGLVHERDVKDFLDAGFTEPQILEIILAIAVKTLSNYSNHLFHTQMGDTQVGDIFVDWEWKDMTSDT